MAMPPMQSTYDDEGFVLQPRQESGGWLSWLKGGRNASLHALMKEQPALAWALGELEAKAEELDEPIARGENEIRISHRLAAHLPAAAAEPLGLPPPVDLTLRCDLKGTPEDPDFRILCLWQRNGREVVPPRIGAVLELAEGPRRLPGPIFDALQIADAFNAKPPASADERWTALARFRQALLPLMNPQARQAVQTRLDLVAALRDLRISLVDRFSLDIRAEGADFDVVPFSSHDEEVGEQGGHGEVSERKAALSGGDLASYQAQLRRNGARHVMRIGRGHCVVTDSDMLPAFETAARFLSASAAEKREFIRNPRPYVAQAIEARLREKGRLEGLSAEGVEEIVGRLSDRAFLETKEYAERVRGIGEFERVTLPPGAVAKSTWVPEDVRSLTERLREMDAEALLDLLRRLSAARQEGGAAVEAHGLAWPADDVMIHIVEQRLADLQEEDATAEKDDGRPKDEDGRPRPGRPVVLLTYENVYDLVWRARWQPRGDDLPLAEEGLGLNSRLRTHQQAALRWQAEAWMAGAPGILNADEQGLGKTLETLAFIRWLAVRGRPARAKRPDGDTEERKGLRVLIVAPVSLLRNWEQETQTHLETPPAFIRLYGSHLNGLRTAESGRGNELKTGRPLLDVATLEAVADAHGEAWFITSYDTMVNYQHSLGALIFDVAVFDEIQALKNPATLRHGAARAMNADFRIGLTGTPIENSVGELWSIMDVLAPGALGQSLSEFQQTYGDAEPERLAELSRRIFDPVGDKPPLALRRLKEDVAADLPEKTWRLYPAFMPEVQQAAYDEGFAILAEEARKGQHLKFLQHIRAASLHPCLVETTGCHGDLLPGSARLQLLARILDDIRERGERALIFLESRVLQHQLANWLTARYDLGHVDIINGQTPVDRRRRIVARFQDHLQQDRGFDVLILSPRAAGAGLTLTAACHVIHLSRWWNPAVEDQCTDRVHRIGQMKDVTVHIPMAIHPQRWRQSFDFSLQELLMAKRRQAREVLCPLGDTEADVKDLVERTTLEDTSIPDVGPSLEFFLSMLQESLANHGLKCRMHDDHVEHG